MKRNCDYCRRPYMAQRPQSKYCSAKCRVQMSRTPKSYVPVKGKKPPKEKAVESKQLPVENVDLNDPSPSDHALVRITKAELEAAGVLDTMLGQQALRVATQMCGYETAGGMASLSKELSRVMAEAMRAAVPLVADPVDELAARRDAKLADAG